MKARFSQFLGIVGVVHFTNMAYEALGHEGWGYLHQICVVGMDLFVAWVIFEIAHPGKDAAIAAKGDGDAERAND